MGRLERTVALTRLLQEETVYLLANGWMPSEQNFKGTRTWSMPSRERHQNITQGHAVNAQKQADRRAGLFEDSRAAQNAFGGGEEPT